MVPRRSHGVGAPAFEPPHVSWRAGQRDSRPRAALDSGLCGNVACRCHTRASRGLDAPLPRQVRCRCAVSHDAPDKS